MKKILVIVNRMKPYTPELIDKLLKDEHKRRTQAASDADKNKTVNSLTPRLA